MLVALIVVGMVLLVTCAALWPEPDEPGQPVKPSTPEGTLIQRLLTGEIDKRQYQAEQARLAARDAERHPLALPDDRL
ncbi:hypothetical protein [Actinoplanes subglobosus]|uniref:SHOCT domain-containing protein n=1 Tax=Actinoplanes subglobosus TaxID=1547892 RepID=A0ABV8J7S3_9ACTN